MRVATALALVLAGAAGAAAQVPPDIAARLRALGPVVNPPAVAKIYADETAKQATDGVIVTRDVAYGPDPRNVLDVYRPADGGGARPMLVFLHGGGFVRGDKADRANVGWFFARHGVVALIPSYRLAPKDPWPAGARDVAAMAAWARANAASIGGDPTRLTLGGESAGAANVAAAALMPGIAPAGGLGAAKLVLMSGVYDADLEARAKVAFGLPTPDPRNDAYFGADPAGLAEKSTVLHVGGSPVPVLLTYSALDPSQMQVQAGELFATLCRSAWGCPTLRVFADHDHISGPTSFGTSDASVSGPVLDFVTR